MQVLNTKLSIPPLRSRLVERSRLFQKLNQGFECGFILISAPAGYGKSTLLSAWLSQADFASTWLSLDEIDNDPSRFLVYLAAALQVIDPCIEDAFDHKLSLHSPSEVETFLTPLINHLAQIKHPFCLVFDDYHLIQDQVVHQVVSFLLERRPAPFHLVIASRADPPLPLSRLRARSGMLELRQADLCFTPQEASSFLTQTMGVEISPEDAARITARTEGWIAGLQMAALSMQTTEDISGFITTLTGSHHYIFDYLLEEILERQTPEIRRFLLYTASLDQFSAPLCDALLKEDKESYPIRSSSAILDELERANLFILPLDHERRWYRYHSLFAEILRDYLRRENAGQILILNARASVWFEEQGLISDAIHHAMAANEWERAILLISSNVFALLEQNELSAVARQLDSVNSEKSRARPWLWIGRAWLAAYTGQLSSVESILNLAESEINSFSSQEDQQTLRGHSAAIRAYTAWIGGKRDIAVRAAREALECLAITDSLLRCQSATVLGLSLEDMDERSQALEQALLYARASSVSHITFFTHGCWAYNLVLRGRLHEAHAACLEAMRLAQSGSAHDPLPTLCYIYATLSLILCEWNDLTSAVEYARRAVALARRWEQADALHFAYTNLGNALFAQGNVAEAFDILNQAQQLAHRTSTWFEEITIAQEVDWRLAQDNLEAALQRLSPAQENIQELSQTYTSPLLRLSSGQVFVAQKQYTKALAVISPLIDQLENRKVVYILVSALAWQSAAYNELGQETQALASLKRALMLAAPEGYIRSFLLAGGVLIPVLHKARAAKIAPDYVHKLLAVIERVSKPPPARAGAASDLVEPLSEREMDVLKLLAQGCSDKKIAETLVIARETVHKHLKNIYGKLGVHSRTEAIVSAREFGLL